MGYLEYAYPAGALAVGALLYRSNPGLYVGFTWWVWFLTPEVRRLVDYALGWDPVSAVMLAPYLVAAPVFFALVHHLPKLGLNRFFPFFLIFSSLIYAYTVGVFRVGLPSATFQLLEWSVPVGFAFYILVHWRRYPEFRRAVRRTFILAVLAMGVYGLVQFFVLPAWDQYWMLNAPITSIGYPEPLEVRVFSTLNSSAPFAMTMMAGLLLLFDKVGPLRWPAAATGCASFLLSLVRSAWGGWIVGLLFIFAQQGRSRPRLLITLVSVLLVGLPLLTVGPIAGVVDSRLQTITSIGQDNSFRARVELYAEYLPQAVLSPVGEGLGSTGLGTRLSTGGELGEYGSLDSGIMELPLVLGWPGSMLYLAGLAWLLVYALRYTDRADLFAAVSRGIVVAMLSQLVFDSVLYGLPGMLLWSFLALAVAAGVHHNRTSRTGRRETVPDTQRGRPRAAPEIVARESSASGSR